MRQRSSSRDTPRSGRSDARRDARPKIGVLDASLRLLGRRAHSQVELRRKLARRGYSAADTQAAIGRLIEHILSGLEASSGRLIQKHGIAEVVGIEGRADPPQPILDLICEGQCTLFEPEPGRAPFRPSRRPASGG